MQSWQACASGGHFDLNRPRDLFARGASIPRVLDPRSVGADGAVRLSVTVQKLKEQGARAS